MKIAYLVSDYSAPSHTFVRREVAALRLRGVEIAAFSVQPVAREGEAESLLGRPLLVYFAAICVILATRPVRFVSTWRLALRHRVGGLRALLWSQFHFVEALLLARRLRAEHVGHLHNHFANSGATVGMLAAHCANVPWSLTLHGISETDPPAGALLAGKIERARFVACASYFMQAQAMRLVNPAQWAKMHIIRCGIDLAALPKAQKVRSARASTPPRLVSVGRLSPEKGYAGLLSALAALVAEGRDFALTIVGGGPAADAVREQAATLGLAEKIEFTGPLPERSTLARMAEADIFVLPSLMEGLPVVLIEALALQLPVVASRVAGIPELVEDDVTGRLFTASDWDDLKRALGALIDDRKAWIRLGEAGRRRVADDYQAHSAAARMSRLLTGLG